MRVSTRPRTSATPTAASAVSAAPEPKTSPDGHFVLHCSDDQHLTNIGQSENFRFFRKPVRYDGPDTWYADYNQHGFPNTLRIYRLDGDDRPKEVYKYRYVPEKRDWEKEAPPKQPPSDSKHDNSRHLPREQPNRSLTSLIAVLRWFARKLLWPIADSKWREKLLKRQRFLGLTPIQTHFFDKRGCVDLFGDTLKSVQLRHDGSVLVDDEVLWPHQAPRVIPRRGAPDEPWLLWFGDTLIIKGDVTDAILTYELDHWQQWGPYRHSLYELIGRDLDITRRTGERFLRKGFSFCWRSALVLLLLLLIIGIYQHSTDYHSLGRNAPSDSHSQSPAPGEELHP